MQRTIVQIARMRLADVQPGDVISGHPEQELGWFQVQQMRRLPSGEIVASGHASTQSVKGTPWDLIGIQVTKQVDVPTDAPAPTASAN